MLNGTGVHLWLVQLGPGQLAAPLGSAALPCRQRQTGLATAACARRAEEPSSVFGSLRASPPFRPSRPQRSADCERPRPLAAAAHQFVARHVVLRFSGKRPANISRYTCSSVWSVCLISGSDPLNLCVHRLVIMASVNLRQVSRTRSAILEDIICLCVVICGCVCEDVWSTTPPAAPLGSPWGLLAISEPPHANFTSQVD